MRELLLCLCLSFPLLTWGQRPELVVPVGHSWGINAVAFSPPCPNSRDCPFGNGKYILTGGGDGIATLWDSSSGKQLQSFEGHLNAVSSVAFSPDGKRVLTGSWDGAAKLWDIQSGTEIRSFEWYSDPSSDFISNDSRRIETVAFSPDGDSLLTSFKNDTTVLWDVHSGALIRTCKGQTATFSPACPTGLGCPLGNGKYVLSIDKDNTAILYETRPGQKGHTLKGHHSEITAAAISPNEKYLLTGSGDNTAILWDVESGRRIRTLKGHTDVIFHMASSPNGKYLLAYSMAVNGRNTFSEHKATVWDMQSGRRLSTLMLDEVALFSYPPIDAAFSPDGQSVVIGSRHRAALWDIRTGRQTHAFDGGEAAVTAVAFSADGKYVLTGGNSTVLLWDAQSGKPIRPFEGVSSKITALAFSADGKYALSGGDKAIIRWDVLSGLPVLPFIEARSEVTSVAFSSDGKYVLSGHKIIPNKKHENFFNNSNSFPNGDMKAAILWEAQSGKEIYSFKREASRFTDVAFSADGAYILTGYTDDTNIESPEYTAIAWDAQTGRQARSSADLTGQVFRGAFSHDGKYLFTGNWTNTIKIWDFLKGAEIASLNSLDSTDWVVTTPSGLFDASTGAMGLMYYLVKSAGQWEVIELKQLKERYYEPGLLQKLMGYSYEPPRSVDGLDTVNLYPLAQLKLDSQLHQLKIVLTPRRGGLGKVSVFINGKEVIEDAIALQQHREGERAISTSVNLMDYRQYFLPDSLNTISVFAWNEADWLKSPEHTVSYRPRFAQAKGEPTDNEPTLSFQAERLPALFAIIVGTADYAGEKLDLKFPGKDAEAMARAIQQAGGQLFDDRVYIRLFTTDTADVSLQPNKRNIKAAFDEFTEQARAEDILLVYLSGHGVTYGDAERAQFYYLTQEIASENLSDDGIRNNRAISTADLTKWINDIPALKQVMIIDACNSGKVVEILDTGTKNLNSSQIRALDRMTDRTGMFVLAGSAADKVSYEASQYGQGLLTYSILEAMSGRGLREGKYIDVVQLFEYARDRVPEMAKNIGGIQTPTMLTPRSGSIYIGIVNNRVKIPLSPEKPIFVRNAFQDEYAFDDVLKISKLLEQQLWDITSKGARANLIYIDIPEYQNAYSIKGRYEVNGETVKLKARLFRESQALGDIQVQGTAGRLEALAEEVLQQALGLLQKK